jgi:chaperone required for assembly of F1-ATPase
MQVAQRGQRPELPRRFYKTAAAGPHEGGFALFLDGRAVKTPGRRVLAVPRAALAEALAAEWGGQGERIEPATMPLTRIANAALDHVADAMPAVRAEIVKYAGSDLICYRAEAPQTLADRQAAVWDPLVRWAREALGAPLVLAAGVVHVAQAEASLAAVDGAVAALGALELAAASTVTTLTGSAIIALAMARGRLSAEEAWAASLIDEDWEISQWGEDETAMKARAFRWREMAAAGLILNP